MHHLLASQPQGAIDHILHHFFSEPRAISIAAAVDEGAISTADIEACQRLLAMWQRMSQEESEFVLAADRPNDGVWEMVRHEFHGPLYEALGSRDCRTLASTLRHAAQTQITYGLGVSGDGFRALADPLQAESYLALIWDRLLSLAEAIGALPVENPEQGRYGINWHLDPIEVIGLITDVLGTDIARPKVMGLFGIAAGNGVIDARVPDDAYTAHLVLRWTQRQGVRTVSEIGGGLGGLALQAVRAGVESWKLYDLPAVAVMQGYFLIRALGASKVRLYGEEPRGEQVEVWPYWRFHDQKPVGLVVNRDSFPEIQPNHAAAYLRTIQGWAAGSTLLSINQEGAALAGRPNLQQTVTAKVVAQCTQAERRSRSQYWIRKGYVEEMFEFPRFH